MCRGRIGRGCSGFLPSRSTSRFCERLESDGLETVHKVFSRHVHVVTRTEYAHTTAVLSRNQPVN